MPGQPAKFTETTIIFVSGSSGSGKTTLCAYLCDKRSRMCRISTDKLFTLKQVEKHKGNINDHLYEKNIVHLEAVKNPQQHVHSISYKLSSEFLVSLIASEITETLRKDRKLKCLVVEGYALQNDDVCMSLAKKFKNREYRVWTMGSI